MWFIVVYFDFRKFSISVKCLVILLNLRGNFEICMEIISALFGSFGNGVKKILFFWVLNYI